MQPCTLDFKCVKVVNFVTGCETICKNSIQYILPGALAIILVTFIFEPWEEIYAEYSGKEDDFDTRSTPDLITFFTAPGDYELIITVYGPEEHLTNYERRDTGHKVFGILTEPEITSQSKEQNSHLCQMFLMSTQLKYPWNVQNFSSNPPQHGLTLVETRLTSPTHRLSWLTSIQEKQATSVSTRIMKSQSFSRPHIHCASGWSSSLSCSSTS